MTLALYDKGRNAFLKGEIAALTDTLKYVLIDAAAYTVDLANDEFLSDIPAPARISTTAALTGKTAVAGVLDADDPVFPLATGPVCEAMVLIKDTGSAATSPLILYNDEAGGLPVTLNGGDITNLIDPTTKILKL